MSDTIILAPLGEIKVLPAWNARSAGFEADGADPDSDDGGFEGLEASMVTEGSNHDPVTLRPNRGPKSEPKYILVDGERRLTVARKHGWATLRAVVEEMTEYEARVRNIQAATGRVRFKPADLAWGIAELKRLGGPALSNDDIGQRLGISSRYAGNLLRIMTDVDDRVTLAWRTTAVKVNVPSLQRLTVLPKERHWKEWEGILLDSQTRPASRGKFTDALRLENRARELGRTLGALVALGAISGCDRWQLAARHLRKNLTPEDEMKLAIKIEEGYHQGLLRKDVR